jgi:hypothetical protein
VHLEPDRGPARPTSATTSKQRLETGGYDGDPILLGSLEATVWSL